MANLINTIPVKTPQNPALPAVTKKPEQKPAEVKNFYPQTQIYEYLPAKPLSPARTTPKFTRPVAASGEIINENVWQSAVSTVKSYGDYAKNFYNAAFKGEGDDYKVGKINDLSIRAGSLGIASILATAKFFPFARGMEFVGLGTWFASMALWPQIIGAPIKALTGVNINQKYKDSYGRKKCVFEDNQYRPMDLFRHLDENGKLLSEKEYYNKYQYDYVYLDKLADKMGIPRDKKNRHEAAMEKMGQVAVQGRTLTMLTAGVMTPVLSSIIADALQNPLKAAFESVRKYNNLGSLTKLGKQISGVDDNPDLVHRSTTTDIDTVMEKLGVSISDNKMNLFKSHLNNKDFLTPAELKKFEEYLLQITQGTMLQESIADYTKNELTYKEAKVYINKNLWKELEKSTAQAVKEAIAKMPPKAVAALPETVKNYQGLSEADFLDAVKTSSAQRGESFASKYSANTPVELKTEEISSFRNSILRFVDRFLENSQTDEELADIIRNAVNEKVKATFDAQKLHYIKADEPKLIRLFKFIETHKAICKKIDNFKNATIEDVSESVTANNWAKVPQKYLDILGLQKHEIAQLATMEPSTAGNIIRKKFEEIAADEAKFKKAVSEMSQVAAEAIAREEKAALALIGTMEENGVLTQAKDLMSSIAKYNFGGKMEENVKRCYSNEMKKIQYKLRNTTDSFVRPIKALDTFRNIEKNVNLILGSNPQQYADALKDPHFYMFSNLKYEEAKASLIDFIKDVVMDKNDINNWSTKMEHDVPGTKKGIKHSKHILKKIAEIVNGSLDSETETIIDLCRQKTFKDYINEKQFKHAFKRAMRVLSEGAEKQINKIFGYKHISDSPLSFSQKINLNNSIMRFRFLNIHSKLAVDYNTEENICYMKDYFPTEEILRDICKNKKLSDLYLVKGWLAERREEIPLQSISRVKGLIETIEQNKEYKLPGYTEKVEDKLKTIFGDLDFATANKPISEMTGKNITDFFVQASQNRRSRNKWVTTAYGLLAATTAITAYAISKVGKPNYFNPEDEDDKKELKKNANIR